ncbi:ATP-dependent 6-phosphofructokinase [Candidatus Heimdallarchaeota archaeon B3_Heim]|nr:MAG: ATP-dependent 6-phosphofructokinase [Candidatus Heimdallarchaeota archaeon B3_Heim]
MPRRKKIGVLCSGGDAPGMNAALRSIVRRGIAQGLNIVAIHRGYKGIFDEAFEKMIPRSVGNIIQTGGTVIKTARCERFYKKEGVRVAAKILKSNNFDGLIAIGGDGTFRGLLELQKYWDGQIIGVPGTIDNDIYGTDYTIGFDTALDTAIQALDRIRDTADSHERVFIVEVMGRNSGFIALKVGIGSGAEEILIPEDEPIDLTAVATRIKAARDRGKTSLIIIVAEGVSQPDIFSFCKKLTSQPGLEFSTHISILGHLQRGGSPSAVDRWNATRMGAYAVDCISEGESGIMVGEQNLSLVKVPLADTQKKKSIDRYAHSLIHDLAI